MSKKIITIAEFSKKKNWKGIYTFYCFTKLSVIESQKFYECSNESKQKLIIPKEMENNILSLRKLS